MSREESTLDFSEIRLEDVPRVGGKNASLGQLWNALRPKGVGLVDGFATTAEAYRRFLKEQGLEEKLRSILTGFDPKNVAELEERGHAARAAVLETPLPQALKDAIVEAADRLSKRLGREPELAVRSSATAEDLPDASFAGQQETYLNVRGREALLRAVHDCFASLYTNRAISYRTDKGFDHLSVALSVGVMPMVRSDLASAGVMFTLDTESGFRDVVVVTSAWGLGESVVQGVVTPDEWIVFKPTLDHAKRPIVGRRLGTKEVRLRYGDGRRATRSEPVPAAERARFSLSDPEVLQLARWACLIEQHYSKLAGKPQPMDIEWAKDGVTGELVIVQARPETVHSSKPRTASGQIYHLHKPDESLKPLLTGLAVGGRIVAGKAHVVKDVRELASVATGDVLVAPITDPDWEPVMKRAAALVTDQGGRTSHAAIVSRELGLPCIVGTANGTQVLRTGQEVTVSCARGDQGEVYEGRLPFEVETLDAGGIPVTRTKVMLNVADPDQAFTLATVPNAGVGLARMEFIVTSAIGIHPMALAHYPRLSDAAALKEIAERIGEEDPKEFFVRRLAEGVGRIGAAFHPKPVIVRMSDFKTNEYAKLIGGAAFEPKEENPMLGFRGASRYADPDYAEGFALECAAMKRIREDMGLTNVKIMIPFCRTVEEGKGVIAAMAAHGLRQGENGLEIYAMCEIPSNVVLAQSFLEVFDGYSIGSNDLTQLVLGLDRDSGKIAKLYGDEPGEAVKILIAQAIRAAHRAGKPIGICGQAPSDYPDFAAWLVEEGITSVSLNPDSAVKTALRIAAAEKSLLSRGGAAGTKTAGG